MTTNKAAKKIQPTNPDAAPETSENNDAEAAERKTGSVRFGRKTGSVRFGRKTGAFRI